MTGAFIVSIGLVGLGLISGWTPATYAGTALLLLLLGLWWNTRDEKPPEMDPVLGRPWYLKGKAQTSGIDPKGTNRTILEAAQAGRTAGDERNAIPDGQLGAKALFMENMRTSFMSPKYWF